MKKRAFLAPLAVSVAALMPNAQAQATTTEMLVKPVDEITTSAPQTNPTFVIERADPSGVLMAQHYSHASHSSHASHVSHYSGR